MEVKIKDFNPITITIHTKEEARILWHLLNCPISGTSIKEWFKVEGEVKLLTHTLNDMWHNFNEVYPLRKR
jgi:hypothetical protein